MIGFNGAYINGLDVPSTNSATVSIVSGTNTTDYIIFSLTVHDETGDVYYGLGKNILSSNGTVNKTNVNNIIDPVIKAGTTSGNCQRVWLSIGGAGSSTINNKTFTNIQKILAAKSTAATNLIANFAAIANHVQGLSSKITFVGFDLDNEDAPENAVVPLVVQLYQYGLAQSPKIIYPFTYCPFTNEVEWFATLADVYSALNPDTANPVYPQPVVGINLQTYAGGAGNDPVAWTAMLNTYVSSHPGTTGLATGDGFILPIQDDSTAPGAMEKNFQEWGSTGGSFWCTQDIATSAVSNTWADYAEAIASGTALLFNGAYINGLDDSSTNSATVKDAVGTETTDYIIFSLTVHDLTGDVYYGLGSDVLASKGTLNTDNVKAILDPIIGAGTTKGNCQRVWLSLGGARSNTTANNTFTNIQTILSAKGSAATNLIANFAAIASHVQGLSKEITTVGFDMDNEDAAVSAVVPLIVQLYQYGLAQSPKVTYAFTFCPFTNESEWFAALASIYSGLNSTPFNPTYPQPVVGMNLQTYAGGTGNDPATWTANLNSYLVANFGQTGLINGNGFILPILDDTMSPDIMEKNLKKWGSTGGSFWCTQDIAGGAAKQTWAQYAAAIAAAIDPLSE
ncbi:hypothetical protein UCD39_12170 [Nitrospirillum sp. BR 11752]|uniref:hypothetical protein n=1 Tax=Nitrospirillum sp. BR 11752 TaxID=3104293 RepID=UPI002EB84483|nr:hypothetical protein [Nitrospirillum sp. BR 11752]